MTQLSERVRLLRPSSVEMTQQSERARPLLWQHVGPLQLLLSQQPVVRATPHGMPPRELQLMTAPTSSPRLRTCRPMPT